MSSSFNLPTQKGTEVWPQETALPAVTRFVDFDKSTGEAEQFMRSFGSRLRQFHQAQAQNHSLRTTEDTRNTIVLDNKYRVTYLNQMGMETITVEKYVNPQPEFKQPEPTPENYTNEPYVFIGMRRNVAGDVDSGGYPNGYLRMVVYQKDSDDVYHDFYSEYYPSEMPNLKPCLEFYYGENEDVGYTLPDNKGNGAALVYGAGAIDPVDSTQWDIAFVWNSRDTVGILEALGITKEGDKATMRGRGPIGPIIAKCVFNRDHCKKKSTTVDYIVILGVGATRQVKRGTFGIERGSTFDFLMTPGGYYSDEELQTTEVKFFPYETGDCREVRLDNGANPHWKNWWQGALVVNPAGLIEKQPAPASSGAIVEEEYFVPSWGFGGGIPNWLTEETDLCEPCEPHVVKYSTRNCAQVIRDNYVYDMSDLFPACYSDMGGLAGPPTRYMVYNKAGASGLGSGTGSTYSYTFKDIFTSSLFIDGLGDPNATQGLGAYLNSREITSAQMAALIPNTLRPYGSMSYGSTGDAAVFNGETIEIPTTAISWTWNGGSRALPMGGGIQAQNPLLDCGLTGGYIHRTTYPVVFEENLYPIQYASKGYIFADQYAVYPYLGGRSDLIDSPFGLLDATFGPAYLSIPPGVFVVRVRFDYTEQTFTIFKTQAEYEAALLADMADPNIIILY